jgi:very-short-patch-repair endonuclease
MKDKEIINMYQEQKLSTYQIAKKLNTYPNKIRRILIRNNVELNDKSQAQKNALAQGQSKIPTQGRKRSEEERIKISKSLKKRWDNLDDETYQEYVARAKKRWNDMSAEEKNNISKSAIQAIQKAGKEGSKLEKFLKEELTKQGFKIEIHKKNLLPNQNLEIDMYFPEMKAIIEIDGPSHFLPIWGEEKLQKQIKSDSHKTGLILSKGFVIIRVKHLSDGLCLSDRHNLKDRLADLLHKIEDKIPKKSERYIELEA